MTNPFIQAIEDFQKEVTESAEEKRVLEDKADELYGYVEHYSKERNAVIEKINAISRKQFVAQMKYMSTFARLMAQVEIEYVNSED